MRCRNSSKLHRNGNHFFANTLAYLNRSKNMQTPGIVSAEWNPIPMAHFLFNIRNSKAIK